MSYLIKPKNYKPLLDLKQTELGIKQIKEFFQLNLSSELRLNMPVEGEVLEINESINDQPELVNNDPYGEGWMIKIRVVSAAELDTIMYAEAYKEFIG